MTSTDVKSEILQLETRYWDAIRSRDIDSIMSMTADPCLVVGPQGITLADHRQMRELWSTDEWRVRSFDVDERQATVQSVADNVAVVAYPIKEELEFQGNPQTMDAYDSSVWVRQDGRWLCAAHTESPSLSMR